MLVFSDNNTPLLVSQDVSKDVLVELVLTRIAARNPEDTSVLANGQLAMHPGLIMELGRLKSRLLEMDLGQLRACMIHNRFDFCEG